jgi:NAD(P)-dependent dehydrogenase (short-subunit alcohol dehydrogenase family)
MGRLDDRVAVVTGGANGIGRACCERFAEEGADIVVADVLDEPGAATIDAVNARGRRAVFVHLDATSEADNETVMRTAVEAFGSLDILVTAAGISHPGYRSGDIGIERDLIANLGERMADPAAAFLATEIAGWHEVLDVNLTGTFLAVLAAGRVMATQRRGSIITIASIAAKHPEAGPVAYGVSKAGVWMLTKQAARSLGPAGIRVNAIGPGFIETHMTAILREAGVQEMLTGTLPLGRIGKPEEVAAAAVFLASDESSYFTGEILHPDGGFYTD